MLEEEVVDEEGKNIVFFFGVRIKEKLEVIMFIYILLIFRFILYVLWIYWVVW